MDYDQYRPALSEKNTCTHTCGASPCILAPFITSGKWWPVGQIGTRNSKTVVGIAPTHICELKTWIMINIDQLHHLTHWLYPYMWCFFSHFDSIPAQWQMMACGSNRGTRNSKTVVGIAGTDYLWIQEMEYDQYRPATSGKMLVPIHLVLLWSFASIHHLCGKW
jgi:hypothetical protein